MRYGVLPASNRDKDEILAIADIAQKKFLDTIWIDSTEGIDQAATHIQTCAESTSRVFYGIIWHPKLGDKLVDIGTQFVNIQKLRLVFKN